MSMVRQESQPNSVDTRDARDIEMRSPVSRPGGDAGLHRHQSLQSLASVQSAQLAMNSWSMDWHWRQTVASCALVFTEG